MYKIKILTLLVTERLTDKLQYWYFFFFQFSQLKVKLDTN